MTQTDKKRKQDSNSEASMSIAAATIAEAETTVGLSFTDTERELMLTGVNERLTSYEQLRTVALDNSLSPALAFNPELPKPSQAEEILRRPISLSRAPGLTAPADLEDLAFAPVAHQAELIRRGSVSSLALTEMYLGRLKRFGPALECVITLTEELALSQAKQADEEIAGGHYRGPLHGIPWGAKDLLSTRDIPTTWGAMPFKDQVIDTDATVIERLREAGAVLVAKLTLGALAWGDVWFGGQTKNPWNLEEGSRGSSAGSAAAVAAGLVGFAIGTETYGSIISPCHRCGVTGLRPTFGRVSRYGAMALSWSMDKIGPICRTVEDCALVFNAIHGADGRDRTAVTRPFHWDPGADLADARIGFVSSAYEEQEENKVSDQATLQVLREMGADLIPFELPDLPIEALTLILWVEAAAAFDELTRSDRDELLVRQSKDAWPNVFREARLIPAVEYIQANRIRTLLIEEMARTMQEMDAYVVPSFGGPNTLMTNLTGHPAVVVPNGLSTEGIPNSSITFIGRLYDEARLLALAKAYQDATEFHLPHPKLDS